MPLNVTECQGKEQMAYDAGRFCMFLVDVCLKVVHVLEIVFLVSLLSGETLFVSEFSWSQQF